MEVEEIERWKINDNRKKEVGLFSSVLFSVLISSLKPPSCSCPASTLAPQCPPAFITMATAPPVFYVVMVTGVEAQAIFNKVEMA